MQRYGRPNISQIHITQNKFQILSNKDIFLDYYNRHGRQGLAEHCGCNYNVITRLLDKYGIERSVGRSSYERSICVFLDNLGVPYKTNDRSICYKWSGKKYELDFIINNKVAIEFNGLITHSEIVGKKDKYYHLMKLEICEKENLKLLTIFEDEFLDRNDVVLSKIKNILGYSEFGNYARNLNVSAIPHSVAKTFLDKYHLQKGIVISSFNVGAFDDDKLVGVMAFGPNRSFPMSWELKRYACDHNYYPGLAQKLLTYFENRMKPYSIITYADRRWSNGDLYRSLDFDLHHISQPSMFYTKDYRHREHKSNYSKSSIKRIWNLPSDFEFQETDFMLSKGYDRIWDCGYYCFIKRYT